MFALLILYGMDIHASIHAVEEEFLIMLVVNVFAQQVIGMVLHVLFVLILKFGADQDLLVFVLLATGMV